MNKFCLFQYLCAMIIVIVHVGIWRDVFSCWGFFSSLLSQRLKRTFEHCFKIWAKTRVQILCAILDHWKDHCFNQAFCKTSIIAPSIIALSSLGCWKTEEIVKLACAWNFTFVHLKKQCFQFFAQIVKLRAKQCE